MQMVLFKILILVLLFSLDTSSGKIVYREKKNNAVGLIKHFFQNKIIPGIKTVKIVNFGYDVRNPLEFQILMKSLNEKPVRATLFLSDFEKTELKPCDHVFLILLAASHTQHLFEFIEQVRFKELDLANIVILLGRDFDTKIFSNKHEKPKATNFYQIIYVLPSDEPPTDDVSPEVPSETLVIYLENVLLSKLSLSLEVVKFNTNKDKIHSTLNILQWQQIRYMKEINQFPIKVLLYLRPLSVEKNPPNSGGPFTGVEIHVLNLLTEMLGSPYTLELGKQEEFGTYYANHTPTRAVTGILDGSYDLSINRYPVLKSGEGMEAVTYADEEYCFIMRMPKNQLRKWSFYMPFRIWVWLSFIIVDALFSTIFMFIKEKNWKVIWLLQSIFSASRFPGTRHSHRFLWSVWLMFHLIINTTYLCFFVTQLYPREKQHPYKTLQDLITKNVTFISEAGHFREIQDVFGDNKLTPYYGKPEDINESSALLTSRLTRLKLLKQFGSEFYKVDECLLKRTVGPLLSTRNPNFKNTVSIFQKIVAAGIGNHWSDIYLNAALQSRNRTNTESDSYEKKEFSPLMLKELQNIFIYFSLGLVLSSVVFLCELLHFKFTKQTTKVRPKIVRVFPYTN